jgi:hypothetical protein
MKASLGIPRILRILKSQWKRPVEKASGKGQWKRFDKRVWT